MIPPKLAEALAAAQDDARSLVASETGGRNGARYQDPREAFWYYPPSPAVQAEGRRLCKKHGLAIILLSVETGQNGKVRVSFEVLHRESGESHTFIRDTEAFPDAETRPHGIAGAARHTRRSLLLDLFDIPIVREVKPGEVVKDGAIVERLSPAEAERRELDKLVGEEPEWMQPGKVALAATAELLPCPACPRCELEPPGPSFTWNGAAWEHQCEAVALDDPGPMLPGIDDVGPAEQGRRREFGAMVDALTEDPDADAAARGEVVDVPDAAQLYRAVQAWRGREGKAEADLRSAAGAPPPGKPLTDEDRRALRVFLEREGCWA